MTGKIQKVDSIQVVTTSPAPKAQGQEQHEEMFPTPVKDLAKGVTLETALKVVSPAMYFGMKYVDENKDDIKANVKESADNIRQFKESHPILSKLGCGILPNIILWMDKAINE